jgi:hypothetical protein
VTGATPADHAEIAGALIAMTTLAEDDTLPSDALGASPLWLHHPVDIVSVAGCLLLILAQKHATATGRTVNEVLAELATAHRRVFDA